MPPFNTPREVSIRMHAFSRCFRTVQTDVCMSANTPRARGGGVRVRAAVSRRHSRYHCCHHSRCCHYYRCTVYYTVRPPYYT